MPETIHGASLRSWQRNVNAVTRGLYSVGKAVVPSYALCDRRLVLVFARLPSEERRCKPLVGASGSRRVESLHERLFRHTLASARGSGAATRLVTSGMLPAHLALPGVEVTQQVGATFAARLEHAVGTAFADGWRQVVVIGGDAPSLHASHLRAAFDGLERGDSGRRAVIGPACDGGYYLLALDSFVPALFSDVPLGTSDTGRATEALLAREGFRITRLPPLHDLDDERDARRVADQRGFLRALASALVAVRTMIQRVALMPARRFVTAASSRGPPPALRPH